ncbi:stage III sporulation protein SpoIIIAB [Tepidibacillus infernus]|uniref:Stage III sporulation protein AB n=1 Tax=Tepidibacillus decaturensis TaxID=1413211 RepID=A0A135L2V1_9BACI|nr:MULTISPECIES: stage III sporulation protein SpoIIIAB [Tepidibacillus]KXG43280.1 hypothetical protein U473_04070 [Tepidibacillus decaturensis]GBF11026.1 stage III sporulation protein SpoAB [Tepidibacillus sp. HK-1]
MFKLIGATLIIGASTIAGFQIARNYHERTKQLRILQQALQMLETEIVYGAVPLHLAMEHIGQRITNVVKTFFLEMSENLKMLDGASTYECWRLSIEKHYQKTALKTQDKAILIQFGHTLGISDREDQMKHIRLTMQNLATEEQLARDEQKINEKLSKNLGVLLGILIVILMY